MISLAFTNDNQRQGFTLIELLVVLSIIVILASLLMPAISLAQSLANTTKCGSSLRQIHVATLAYTDDNDGALPPAHIKYPSGPGLFWFGLLGPYADAARGSSGSINNLRMTPTIIRGCPAFKPANIFNYEPGYGMNFWPKEPIRVGGSTRYTNFQTYPNPSNIYGNYTVFTLDSLENPTTRPLYGDSKDWELTPSFPIPRHRGKYMVSFCDGHVAPMVMSQIILQRDNPQKY